MLTEIIQKSYFLRWQKILHTYIYIDIYMVKVRFILFKKSLEIFHDLMFNNNLSL